MSAPPDVRVFRQIGEVASPSRLFPGARVRAGCWIAVRDDLLAALARPGASGPDA